LWWRKSISSRLLLTLACGVDGGDVDFGHFHHGFEGAFGFVAAGGEGVG
jgi:hypothetical protein